MALAPIVAMAIRDRVIVFIVATPVASARCFVRCEFAKLGSVNSYVWRQVRRRPVPSGPLVNIGHMTLGEAVALRSIIFMSFAVTQYA
jgi:hypothetical protein